MKKNKVTTVANKLEAGTYWRDNAGEVYLLVYASRTTYLAVSLVSGHRWTTNPEETPEAAVDELIPIPAGTKITVEVQE